MLNFLTSTGMAGGMSSIFMIVAMLAVFYFMLIRPENKRKKEAEQLRNSVKTGDKVTTIGGIIGTVVNVKEDKIVIETSADQVRMELTKWSISTNETAAEAQQEEAKKRAAELLEYMGLTDRADHKPSEMSGGEKQRVAVARALINNPSVVFADEPSGSLDSKNKEELHQLFFDLRDRLGQTFVIVTHDEALAAITDRTIHMRDGIINEDAYNSECIDEEHTPDCCAGSEDKTADESVDINDICEDSNENSDANSDSNNNNN